MNLTKLSIEAADGQSQLTEVLDLGERQGFEDFCKRTNPHYHPTDDSVIDREAWRIWREACSWQRGSYLKQAAEATGSDPDDLHICGNCDGTGYTGG